MPASAVANSDTGTIAYNVDGVRVIHRHLGTGDIVVANLYLLGGVRQVTAANAGIELLLLEASERGTRSYSRDRLRRSMAQLGTEVSRRRSASTGRPSGCVPRGPRSIPRGASSPVA